MSPSDVLRELEARGIMLTAPAGELRYRGPKGALTDELRQAIRENGEALLALLTGPAVARLTIHEFATTGRVVRIWSELPGEAVLLASDNAAVPADARAVVYRAREFARLLEMEPEMLRVVHAVKKQFGGEIQEQ